MSQEQPGYYSPAPAGGQAPVPGTPSYQYVTPQPLDPSQQQYQQQQQYAQQPPPGTILQQPYYPAQSPAPGFAQPSTVISPEFKEQPAAIYATEAHPAQPVVINVDGIERRGLMGKMHQFEMCCGFIPLHTGAMIIAILSVFLYGGFGLALLVSSTYSGTWYGIVFIILGIVYLGVAAISAAGFMGAYREDPKWVNIFVKFYVIGYFVWAIIQLIQMGISVAYYSNYCSNLSTYYGYSCGFGWAGWIIPFLIGLALQYYFCCCLVSYQRVLLAKLSGGDVEGGKTIEMH